MDNVLQFDDCKALRSTNTSIDLVNSGTVMTITSMSLYVLYSLMVLSVNRTYLLVSINMHAFML